MILGQADIKRALDDGLWKAFRDGRRIGSEQLTINPNSVNVSLGDKFLIPDYDERIDLHDEKSLSWDGSQVSRKMILNMGAFCLGYVRERFDCSEPLIIHKRKRYFAPMIEGRSTIGRCGLSVHECAGFGDHGFNANFTLELRATMPIILRPSDEIAQIVFMEVSCASEGYNSVYKDQYDEPRAPKIGLDRFRRHD